MNFNRPRMRDVLAIILFATTCGTFASARPPVEAELKAAASIGRDIAEWTMRLDPKPASIGIFAINANAPFDQDYAGVMEAEILKNLGNKGLERIGSCSECRSPQLHVEGEKLVIRKGIPDTETLRTIGDRQPYEVFITVDIYSSTFNVTGMVTAYRNHSGEMLGSDRFSAPAVTFNNTSVQLLLTAGLGLPLNGGASADYLIAPNISLLEEVGFGKAGLALGTVLGGSSMLMYIDPTLQFMGHFGSTGIAYGFSIGAGFGLAAGVKALNGRLAYEVFLGSLAVVGLDVAYFLPQGTTTAGSTTSYAGLHLGIAFGR